MRFTDIYLTLEQCPYQTKHRRCPFICSGPWIVFGSRHAAEMAATCSHEASRNLSGNPGVTYTIRNSIHESFYENNRLLSRLVRSWIFSDQSHTDPCRKLFLDRPRRWAHRLLSIQ